MATMKLSITTNDRRCPPGQPVGIVNDGNGDLVGCYRSLVDAERAKEILEAGPPTIAASSSPTIAW